MISAYRPTAWPGGRADPADGAWPATGGPAALYQLPDAPPPPDPKQVIGGACSAAADTYDEVIGFFAPFGRALVAAADLTGAMDELLAAWAGVP